ncbi:hypothetical protein HNQ65_000694 [Prosthecobacter vanneervenii]|uniref:Uncharacterized protein n=1 Tax=Prosthecobacter vanneervenii TaxID=48466 RepID=A0A7W7Y8E2_9BACT|nr:hypothetical protein [Prosthecobacter vanneervenii]
MQRMPPESTAETAEIAAHGYFGGFGGVFLSVKYFSVCCRGPCCCGNRMPDNPGKGSWKEQRH